MSKPRVTEPFQYCESLKDNHKPQIRLLEVQKRSFFGDVRIVKVKLSVHDFDDSLPEYQTLSYAWRDQKQPQAIECNGKSLEVSMVLFLALFQFAERQGYEQRLLWIDQICINQNDNQEKSVQVARMRDIYKRSQQTVAWLGGPRRLDNVLPAITLNQLRLYASQSFGNILKECATAQNKGQKPSESTFVAWMRTAAFQNPWGVSDLLSKTWFRRVWVIQEVAVSRKILVQCSTGKIDFDVLILSIALFVKLSLPKAGMDVGTGANLVQNSELSLMIELRRREFESNRLELLDLIAATHRAGATDIRDKFYSLYGITGTDLGDLGLSSDYSVPARQAVMQATYSLLNVQQDLELLETTEGRHVDGLDLPSWIPAACGPILYGQQAFTNDGIFKSAFLETAVKRIYQDDLKSFKQYSKEQVQRAMQMTKDFCVGDSPSTETNEALVSRPRITFMNLDDSGRLRLHGQILDRIAQVQPTRVHDQASLQSQNDYIFRLIGAKSFRDFARVVIDMDNMVMDHGKNQTYPTGGSIESAYRKVICAGQDIIEDREVMTEAQADEAFSHIRKALVGARATTWLERTAGMDLSLGAGTFLAFVGGIFRVSNLPGVRSLWALIADNLFARLVAWTENGYLALVPANAKVGDCVSLLNGGRMPFILRPKGNDWMILGPSYVHGVTGGRSANREETRTIALV